MRRAGRAVAAAVVAVIGPGELLVGVGLVLLTVALWPAVGRLALVPSSVVMVWIGLPSRSVFLIRPQEPKRKARRAV